jgi:hypothetical protein
MQDDRVTVEKGNYKIVRNTSILHGSMMMDQ